MMNDCGKSDISIVLKKSLNKSIEQTEAERTEGREMIKGNEMQQNAFSLIESLGGAVKEKKDEKLLHTWRMLQNSDHIYYMCTKSLSDQDVHNYFSPYDSPFDAYINYMNVVNDFKEKIKEI